MGKADLHIHTTASDGISTPAAILAYVEKHSDLDVIAITDHDEVRGAYAFRELAAQRNSRIQVIVGCEITTRDGHLVALFIEQRVPMLQSLENTIEAVRKQGGLCIVPHALSWLTFSVRGYRLRQLIASPPDGIAIDAIEGLNTSIAGQFTHSEVKELNKSVLHLPEVGASDAHTLKTIGTGYTIFPGRTIEELRQALAAGTTRAEGAFPPIGDHLHGLAELQWRSMVLHPAKKLGRALGIRRNR
ncbi:MAG: PHP domain-containing protein [Chloroflexi bacterium]|nr:PHP domain-containing protein [Chloroflexota bacterium]